MAAGRQAGAFGRAPPATDLCRAAPCPRPMPEPSPIDPAGLRRVLVTKLRHHGDVLLAAPVIGALARIAPQAQIDALVYAETAPMLAGHPGVSQLHLIDRAWKRTT